jgi:hypothetical protein
MYVRIAYVVLADATLSGYFNPIQSGSPGASSLLPGEIGKSTTCWTVTEEDSGRDRAEDGGQVRERHKPLTERHHHKPGWAKKFLISRMRQPVSQRNKPSITHRGSGNVGKGGMRPALKLAVAICDGPH